MPDLTRLTYAFTRAHPMLLRLATAALPLILSSCGGGYGGGGGGGGGGSCGGAYEPACPPPTVTLTSPSAGTVSGKAVALTATATASSTYMLTITRVDFMVDGTVVGTKMASPYTVNWDSTTVANGSHTITAKATDSASGTATSSAVAVTVQNMAALSATMNSAQMLRAPASDATGTANLKVNLETGATSGTVTLKGIEAAAVSINEAFAGAQGAAVLALVPHGAGAVDWEVPAGALLTAEQLSALEQGRLYVLARSARHPEGEIRGQFVPESIVVAFSALTASPAARSLGITAGGIAATTLDTRTGTLSIEVNARGIEDAMAAQLLKAASAGGTAPLELAKDSVDMGHWSRELADLSPADVAAFRAGLWSVSVATPAMPEGAIGGAIEAGRSD